MTLWFACAACYGQSDSAMAAGMNWGILSLLVVILGVLGGVAGFFIFLARRAAMVNGPRAAAALSLPPHAAGENRLKTWPGLRASMAGHVLRSSSTQPARHACCGRGKTSARFSI